MPPRVPRDAATLIILDTSDSEPKVLMGRRHVSHAFMPGLFVFPGGGLERSDGSIVSADSLDSTIEHKIFSHLRLRPTLRRARGLALAALRETCEETGLLLGIRGEFSISSTFPSSSGWRLFHEHHICPTLSPLRLVARAITPAGQVRRYDTWFFATFADHIAHTIDLGSLADNELQDIHWLTFTATLDLELPHITRVILQELESRLSGDSVLSPSTSIPFYHTRGKRFIRELI